jgi:Tfp pilus assembly protein PilN
MWLSRIFRTILIKKKRGYHHAQNKRQQKPSQNQYHQDYASQIAEKQEAIASLTAEIASIQKAIEEQKNILKEKKTALKKAEKEVATLEAKKAKADAKAAEEAKKAEAETVLKKLLASGMSADEILEKLK